MRIHAWWAARPFARGSWVIQSTHHAVRPTNEKNSRPRWTGDHARRKLQIGIAAEEHPSNSVFWPIVYSHTAENENKYVLRSLSVVLLCASLVVILLYFSILSVSMGWSWLWLVRVIVRAHKCFISFVAWTHSRQSYDVDNLKRIKCLSVFFSDNGTNDVVPEYSRDRLAGIHSPVQRALSLWIPLVCYNYRVLELPPTVHNVLGHLSLPNPHWTRYNTNLELEFSTVTTLGIDYRFEGWETKFVTNKRRHWCS